jgi:capsular polysaccharide biosynthesis protein
MRAFASAIDPHPFIVGVACVVASLRRFEGTRPRGVCDLRRTVRHPKGGLATTGAVSVRSRDALGGVEVQNIATPLASYPFTLINVDPAAWQSRFGDRVIREGPPRLLELEDVFVFPQHRALYDGSGSLIPASVRPVTGRRQMPTFDAPRSMHIPGTVAEHRGHLMYAGTLHQHFGHFLVEGISRLWPLAASPDSSASFDGVLCDRENPLLNARFRRPVLDWVFAGREVPRFACRPMRIRKVTIPEPTWVYWGDAYRRHVTIPRAVAECLGSDVRPTDQPLYLTRQFLPGFRRGAQEEARLASELEQLGVRVLAPERLPITEQIRAILRHKVVIGLDGSALHSSLFASGPERLQIYLVDPSGLPQPSFPVQDALTGIPAAYIGCYRPDPTSSKGGADRDVVLDVPQALRHLGELIPLR